MGAAKDVVRRVVEHPATLVLVAAVNWPFYGSGEHRSFANACVFAMSLILLPLVVRKGWQAFVRDSPDPDLQSPMGRFRARLFGPPVLAAVLNATLASGFFAYHWRQAIWFWPMFAVIGACAAEYQRTRWHNSIRAESAPHPSEMATASR
jgi:cyanate permease